MSIITSKRSSSVADCNATPREARYSVVVAIVGLRGRFFRAGDLRRGEMDRPNGEGKED